MYSQSIALRIAAALVAAAATLPAQPVAEVPFVRSKVDVDGVFAPGEWDGALSIAVEGNAAPEVIRALRGEPTVGTLHTTNGRWDIVAEVRSESLEAFDAALTRIRLTPGIANTETSILLSTYKV